MNDLHNCPFLPTPVRNNELPYSNNRNHQGDKPAISLMEVASKVIETSKIFIGSGEDANIFEDVCHGTC